MLRRIAVHLDKGENAMPRFDLALNMARDFKAEIQCIYTDLMPSESWPQFVYDDSLMAVELINELQSLAKIERDQAEIRFLKRAVDHGITATWINAQDSRAEELAVHARLSDLLIISQEKKQHPNAPYSRGMMEHIVFAAGRPVLALPQDFSKGTIEKKTLLCWDGSREAARALADAAPLLQASDMLILTVKEGRGALKPMAAPMEELNTYCRVHSYSVSKHIVRDAGRHEVGDIIKSVAAEEKVDLIVMGAYGHSRLHELVLGGATKSLLKTSSVPVLLSH